MTPITLALGSGNCSFSVLVNINDSSFSLATFCPLAHNRISLSRHFHASSELLDRHRGPKKPKVVASGKFSKRKKEAKPAVETPYVPPKLTRTGKSSDKTIEIFEGMTIVELAKRCGESISTIENIITNVGEKADSEFDSLSVDIAELVAMVIPWTQMLCWLWLF